MRLAILDRTTNVVLNVLVVDSLESLPEIVHVTPDGKVYRKDEVLIVETTSGSVGDLYIEGQGFYRRVGT